MFPEMRLHRAAMLVLLVACSRSDAPQTETAAARVPAPASPVVTTFLYFLRSRAPRCRLGTRS